jgi:hypothetical protein
MQMNLTGVDFKKWLGDNRLMRRFFIPAFILCIGFFALEQINMRNEFADFRVYYDAAKALRQGDQVYHVAFGVSSGFYKYSPAATIPFLPLTFLPFAWAAAVYFFFIAAAIISFFLYCVFLLSQVWPAALDKKVVILTLITAIVFGADHIERELHLGNVNMLLMCIATLAFVALYRKSDLIAGVCLGLILLFKPHFLILLPYLLFKGKWKALIRLALTIALGLFVLSPFIGWTQNWYLQGEWLKAMGAHNARLELSANTIYGLINVYVFNSKCNSTLVWLTLAVVGAIYASWLFYLNHSTKLKGIDWIEWSLLLALIPSLTHTDTEHFMFSLPCVIYVCYMLFQKKVARYRYAVSALMILAFFPYCLNSPDIVGKKMRYFFDEAGGLGLANLMIITATIIVKMQHPKGWRELAAKPLFI